MKVPQVLGRKLEIEPLNEARWVRIERAVLDATAAAERARTQPTKRPEATPVRWRLAAATLVLAGALAAIGGGLAWRAMVPEARERATRVETDVDGSRVEFGESTIDVGPTSGVRLAGDDAHGVLVTLDRGRVECDVAPRRERPPFVVEAGGVEVRVIGTHFVVVRMGESVSVEVQRGEVEVTSDGARVLVPAGSRWPNPVAASSESGGTAPPETPARDTAAAHVEPHVSTPSAPSAPSIRPIASGSPRDQYEAASRIEASQPDAAIALYRELARQRGAWAENALFAAGRLEADRGDHEEARRLLRDYLGRYPAGPNANDARQLLDTLR